MDILFTVTLLSLQLCYCVTVGVIQLLLQALSPKLLL